MPSRFVATVCTGTCLRGRDCSATRRRGGEQRPRSRTHHVEVGPSHELDSERSPCPRGVEVVLDVALLARLLSARFEFETSAVNREWRVDPKERDTRRSFRFGRGRDRRSRDTVAESEMGATQCVCVHRRLCRAVARRGDKGVETDAVSARPSVRRRRRPRAPESDGPETHPEDFSRAGSGRDDVCNGCGRRGERDERLELSDSSHRGGGKAQCRLGLGSEGRAGGCDEQGATRVKSVASLVGA